MEALTIGFWERCVEAGCVIVPIKVYSEYGADGNVEESKFIGIRFAALPFDDIAVGPNYWFMLDEQEAEIERLHETPLQALQAFEGEIWD